MFTDTKYHIHWFSISGRVCISYTIDWVAEQQILITIILIPSSEVNRGLIFQSLARNLYNKKSIINLWYYSAEKLMATKEHQITILLLSESS